MCTLRVVASLLHIRGTMWWPKTLKQPYVEGPEVGAWGAHAGQQSAPHMHVLVCIWHHVRQFSTQFHSAVSRPWYVQPSNCHLLLRHLAVFCRPQPLAYMLLYRGALVCWGAGFHTGNGATYVLYAHPSLPNGSNQPHPYLMGVTLPHGILTPYHVCFIHQGMH